jgi:DsbC/DsbD-like thiol-disulfide interchange protein
MSFQLLNGARRPMRAYAVASLFTLGFMAELRADPYASAWSAGTKSAARLVAAPNPATGAYKAGVEIRLDPGALTYWRTPGEAGAAPVFDFQKSQNIKYVAVAYPAPLRIAEAGFDMFGYRGGVTFPVDVELADDSRPALLALSLDYAVCSQICLPVKAKAALALPARHGAGAAARVDASPEEASIDAARAKVPLRLDGAEREAKIAVTREDGAVLPTWRVRIKADRGIVNEALRDADRAAADLFVEFPDGWYFESKRSDNPNEFLIVQVEAPHREVAATDGVRGATERGAKIPLTVTLAQPRQSYEFTVDLDVVSARP